MSEEIASAPALTVLNHKPIGFVGVMFAVALGNLIAVVLAAFGYFAWHYGG
jgi:hypothetical protein